MFKLIVLLLLLCGCERIENTHASQWREIKARDHVPTYRVNVPNDWKMIANESLEDTTLALCELTIEQAVRITVHNFPSDQIKDRVPPLFQIHRWKKQLENLNLFKTTTEPQSFNGYVGLFFRGFGDIDGKPTQMLAWSMQVSPEHYYMLKDRQKRGDVTIKAMGDPEQINKYEEAIISFATSFELIDEIPTRS